MFLFRLTKRKYVTDITGIGARLYGGRWNSAGLSVIYTACSIALATLESVVHVPRNIFPKDYVVVTYDLPDHLYIEELDVGTLPTDWRIIPARIECQLAGDEWINRNSSIALKVPSAIINRSSEYNILINPTHKDIDKLSIIKIQDYSFDPRLLKNP